MSSSENWVSHTPTTALPQDYSNSDSNNNHKASPNSKNTSSSKESNVHVEQQQEQQVNRPPSPPTVFEKFFLPIEDPIGFAQAARQFRNSSNNNNNNNNTHNRNRSSNSQSITTESIRTNDFVTAAEDLELDLDLESDDDLNPLTENQLYTNDILGLSQPPILEEYETNSYEPEKTNMTSETSKISTPLEDTTTTAPTSTTESEPAHFDVVDHVYGVYKNVWGFSKEHIVVLKPFMRLTEHVATKVLSTATGGTISSLEVADENITKTIKGIDKDLVDPTILKLWSVLEPLVGKGDEVAKGIIGLVHRKPMIEDGGAPVGEKKVQKILLKKKESTEISAPETSTPGITS